MTTQQDAVQADIHTTAGKIDDLARRTEEAVHAGSDRAVEKQHGRGKKTARERIELLVDEEAAIARIVKRAQEQGRADDTSEEFIRRRIGLFHQKTQPVIDAYKSEGKLIEVSGDGTINEVYERLKKALI